MNPIGAGSRIALLMDGYFTNRYGKLGIGMLRYSPAEIVAVIDAEHAGQDSFELTGVSRRVPIVANASEALALGAEALVLGVAPPGGRLPETWWPHIEAAVAAGALLVNPLHEPLSQHPKLRELGARVWDVRVEPPGLQPGSMRAAQLTCLRVLTVGTDMAVGKMTASLEMTLAARRMGIVADFVATGQTGICIWGSGVAVDAVRLDFAPGAVEAEVLRAASADPPPQVLFIEGQGAINHPAASASLAILRGSMPTHLSLCCKAGQETLWRFPELRIPPLEDLIYTYETMAAGGGAFPRPCTIGICVDTRGLGEEEALDYCQDLEARLGMPCVDPVRHGAERIVQALPIPETTPEFT
jgi:uncharacterized NAD-dependent epimerase/dehydratase family protein